jgi:anaerobic magnesium-protoporphyrin IX monomethyl ester cyclase
MYAPLGLLSVATCLKNSFKDQLQIEIVDEDVEQLDLKTLGSFDVVGFYSTTFNYEQTVEYAYWVKEAGAMTVLGGPHPTVLADLIMANRRCFDYVIRSEAELPFIALIEKFMGGTLQTDNVLKVPNLVYKSAAEDVIFSPEMLVNDLSKLPIPSREYLPIERYVENYHTVYPEHSNTIPGSIYSSKGCSWRDRTGGCVFCARLEEGVRFRPIDQIWQEIEILKVHYGVNLIWDIADDNLNNPDWFIQFVERRPESCKDIRFFIYSRVNPIKSWVIPYFKKLNVEEVFLGIESGDNDLLRLCSKGQTRDSAFKALRLLNDHGIKFYPSFVLGLPGETRESMENTLSMCHDIAELGGMDRISATILKPIPGSPAFQRILEKTIFGRDLARMDVIDLEFLERYWIDQFTGVSYEQILSVREEINKIMSPYHVFGSAVEKKK